jgi:hypothetical protein
LQFHEGAQQIVAQSAGLAQLFHAQSGIVGRRLSRPETLDRDAHVVGTQAQLVHEPARRIDLRLRHPPVGFGDVAHQFEGRAEEDFGYRGGRGCVRTRGGGKACALIEHLPDDGPEHGSPDASGDQKAAQCPKQCTVPSHSR